MANLTATLSDDTAVLTDTGVSTLHELYGQDTANITDSSQTPGIAANGLDTLVITDSVVPTIEADKGLLSELVDLSDAVSVTKTSPGFFTLNLNDEAGITDAALAGKPLSATISDVLLIKDIDSPEGVGTELSITDNAGVEDILYAPSVVSISITDALVIDDANSAQDFRDVISDTAGMTDLALAPRERFAFPNDLMLVTDDLDVNKSSSSSSSGTVDDSVGVADTVNQSTGRVRAAADSLALTDTTAIARGSTVSDAMNIADTVAVQTTGTGSITLNRSDTQALTDNVYVSSGPAQTDTEQITDAVSVTPTKLVSDTLATTDSVTVSYTKAILLSDTVNLSEQRSQQLVVGISTGRTHSDLMIVRDTVDASLGTNISIVDGFEMQDTADVGGNLSIVNEDLTVFVGNTASRAGAEAGDTKIGTVLVGDNSVGTVLVADTILERSR